MATVTLEVPDYLLPLLETVGDRLPLVLEMGASRLAPVSTQAYIEVVQFLAREPGPAAVADFRFSQDVEQRISTLLARNQEGSLSKAEDVELDRLIQLEENVQILKARALATISRN